MGQSDAQQQSDIAHDGIHSTVAERMGNALAPVLGNEPYQTEHQNPYNQAASEQGPSGKTRVFVNGKEVK